MIYTNLSTTDLKVSRLCLWTMNFWAHVSENDSFGILDKALEHWINFLDTAEMYPVPPNEKTFWNTEIIIWNWLKKSGNRHKVVLATKVVWPTRHIKIREWDNRLNKRHIIEAIDWSLSRLGTDYIDLYQLHWPDRNVNTFWQRYFIYNENEVMTEIEETLCVLKNLKKAWKVRYFWLSNESPWWITKFLSLAKSKRLPRMVSVQNNYSLLTRTFDMWNSEVSLRENIWLLAYSPLGYWVLAWTNRKWGRFDHYPHFAERYRTEKILTQIKRYNDLSKELWISLAGLSLAFVYTRPFLTSCIIWPSTISQLEACVDALNIKLTPKILREIDEIDSFYPNPCP